MSHMKTLNPAYVRKILVATQMADAAYLNGGLTGMLSELAFLRRSDADSIILAEFERLYHAHIRRIISDHLGRTT